MIFLDSGYLIALLKPQDELHQRAKRWIAVVKEPLITTEFVLLETADYLSSRYDRAKAGALVDESRSDPNCEVLSASSALLDSGLALYRQRNDKDWSLTDCISFVVMQDRKVQSALAYDIHFEQAGFTALLRHDPPLAGRR